MEINPSQSSQDFVHTSKSLRDIQMDIDPSKKAMIMNMFRNLIYSNPLDTFVREVLSNAFDAHSRANKSDTPIQITFPTSLERKFIVRDFGNSMTSDVIENVYSQLCSSDKNSSNTEIGGFGIGAASPLAYSNVFYIDTFTLEEGCKIHRQWMQYIDQSLIGKLSLLVEEPLTDNTPLGTAVSIPIKEDDFNSVYTAVISYTQFAKVRPLSTNRTLSYDNLRPDFYGSNWQWFKHEDIDRHGSRLLKPKVIIEGIPYPIDLKALELDEQSPEYLLLDSKLYLFFSTGQLDLSISRENLQYTHRTKVAIISLLKSIISDIQTITASSIYRHSNLFDASRTLNTFPYILKKILQPYLWSNIPINPSYTFHPSIKVETFKYSNRAKYNNSSELVLKSECYDNVLYCPVSTSNKLTLFINDSRKVHIKDYKKHIRYYLNSPEGKHIYTLYVITIPEHSSLSDNDIDPYLFSSHLISELVTEPSSTPRSRNSDTADAFLFDRFTFRSRASGILCYAQPCRIPLQPEYSHYYVICDNNKLSFANTSLEDASGTNKDFLFKILSILDIDNLYAVRSSVAKKLGSNWFSLTDSIHKYLDFKSSLPLDLNLLLEYYQQRDFLWSNQFQPLNCLLEFKDKLNPDSLFLRYYHQSCTAEQLLHKYDSYVFISSLTKDLSNPSDSSISNLYHQCLSLYPLFNLELQSFIARNRLTINTNLIIDGLIHYINICDSSFCPTFFSPFTFKSLNQ